jgi:hypothetical protein
MRQQAHTYPPREAASGETIRSKLGWPCRPYNLSESSSGAPTKTASMAVPGISPQLPCDTSSVRRRAPIPLVKLFTGLVLYTNSGVCQGFTCF